MYKGSTLAQYASAAVHAANAEDSGSSNSSRAVRIVEPICHYIYPSLDRFIFVKIIVDWRLLNSQQWFYDAYQDSYALKIYNLFLKNEY